MCADIGFGQVKAPLGAGIRETSLGEPRKADRTGGASFADTLKTALAEVDSALKESDAAAVRLATGEATNLHEVVLATERANLALQLTMAIRNKILEAYNELMRMPV